MRDRATALWTFVWLFASFLSHIYLISFALLGGGVESLGLRELVDRSVGRLKVAVCLSVCCVHLLSYCIETIECDRYDAWKKKHITNLRTKMKPTFCNIEINATVEEVCLIYFWWAMPLAWLFNRFAHFQYFIVVFCCVKRHPRPLNEI